MIFNSQVVENGVDTSDATATATDIAGGKTAYVDGEKVTGTIYDPNNNVVFTNGSYVYLGEKTSPTQIGVYKKLDKDTLIRNGKQIQVLAKAETFGDATADDVVRGKTFTSSAGIKVAGNIPETVYNTYGAPVYPSSTYGENYIQFLIEPPNAGEKRIIKNGNPWSISSGLNNFGNAAAADVAMGNTFTSTVGLKVSGTLPVTSSGSSVTNSGFATPTTTGSYVSCSGQFSSDVLIRQGGYAKVDVQFSSFGDATAADVAAGKTFTSAAGLNVVGTASGGSSAEVVCTIDVDNVSSGFFTIYVNSTEYTLNSGNPSQTITVYKPDLNSSSDIYMLLLANSSKTIQISGWEEMDVYTSSTWKMYEYRLYPGVTNTSITAR